MTTKGPIIDKENSNQVPAVEVRHLSKAFMVRDDGAKTLRERFLRKSGRVHRHEALKDLSFTVMKGEAVGIIGHNGSGKSTTLKLLSRIIPPDEGSIKIRGRVYSLIELGAGFHPDLTGRENIYINASVYGIKKKDVQAKLEDIIGFAELEEWIDRPVRTYSSGMYLRLAFAIAIHIEAEVLLIDEILAVGDREFQDKCLQRLRQLLAGGCAIVLVSHNMDQVGEFCQKAIWLDHGDVKEIGPAKPVTEHYLENADQRFKKRRWEEDQAILAKKKADRALAETIAVQCAPKATRIGVDQTHSRIRSLRMLDGNGEPCLTFMAGDPFILEAEVDLSPDDRENAPSYFVANILRDDYAFCWGLSTEPGTMEGVQKLRLKVEHLWLRHGLYHLDVIIRAGAIDNNWDLEGFRRIIDFEVTMREHGALEDGIMSLPYDWE